MRSLPIGLLLVLLAFAAPAQQRVYQWKDANGVTHYSQSPPGGQGYQAREIDRSRDPEAPPPAQAAAESPQCAQAKANLKALENTGTVLIDLDGDGKPDKTLDEADRAAQRQLAEAGIKAYCSTP